MLKNKIVKNASWIVVSRVVQSVLTLLITMLTARYLGPSNYGVINYASSLVIFITPVVQLGLGNIQVQELINHPEDEGKIIGTTVVLNTVSAIVCYVGVVIFAMVANAGERETILVCVLYSLVLFFQRADMLVYWYQAKYLSKYSSLISLGAYVVVSGYKAFLLVTQKSIYWFALSNTLDYVIITVALTVVYFRLGGAKPEVSVKVAKRMLSKSKHYILANMMVVVFTQTDKIMLKLFLDETATGIYSAAASCASMVNFVYVAVIDSARPTIFERKKISETQFQNSVSMLYGVIIYMSLIVSIGITVFAPLMIRIIYGSAYAGAVGPLRIVAWYTTFSYLGMVRNIWILANNKQGWLWSINLSGAIGNVVLNFILIPVYGAMGAAVASLMSQVIANVIVSYLIPDIRESVVLMARGLNLTLLLDLVKKRRIES